MKLIVAGASHGVPEKHRFCTTLFLCVGDRTYVIDAGGPVSGLLSYYDLPHETVKAVFITHAHSDHLNGLPAFCSELMWWDGYDACVPEFFFPEQKCIDAINSWISILLGPPFRREGLDFKLYTEGVIFDDGVIRVTARQSRHTEHSFAFHVECEGKKIFFTGDLGYGFGEYLDLLGDEEYELVVCEGAHHHPGTVNELLKKTPTKHLIINHLNLEREVELVKLPGTTPFLCELAEDGLTVEL